MSTADTSRERFVLARVTIGKEDLGMCVIDGSSPYFNTTSETGPQLSEYRAKAKEQNSIVLGIFQRSASGVLSPSQVMALWPVWKVEEPPLTSIRRAITTLTQAGALVKTEAKRKGVYGRMEHVWTLPEAQP